MGCVNGLPYHDGTADDFGCKIKHVRFAPSAFPTTPGGAKVAQWNAGDKKLAKDLDAFKRIYRNTGIYAKSTEGAADTERYAESEYELVSGQFAKDIAAKKPGSVKKNTKEWRRRANAAYEATKKGEVITG